MTKGMMRVEEIQVFNNERFGSVRTLMIEDEPWLVGKDVAEALGYSNINKAIQVHVDDEDKKTLTYKGFSHFGNTLWSGSDYSNKTLINESGVYSLIFGSKLPEAKQFKKWVTSVVLPSIRKNGGYIVEQETLDEKELLARAVLVANNVIDEKNRIIAKQTVEIEAMKPKASYYDLVLQSPSLINTSTIAQDYGMTAMNFNKLLHDLRIQYKRSRGKRNVWCLYAKYLGNGYTDIVTHKSENGYGGMFTSESMKWTQKGRLFLYNTLKEHGILPEMEKT